MRRWLLLSVVAGAGCATEPGEPPATGDHPPVDGTLSPAAVPAGDCAQTVSLYGMGGSQPAIVPLSLSTAGVTLCLELDGRDNIQVAHFAANTPNEMAETSSFVLSLYEADGTTLIRTGWDVAFGTTPTTVFANLEAGMPKGQVTNAKLVVATRSGETSSQIHLYLFEPFE
ncbi:MAG TPA: hypothetical protein VLB44_14405 [Kofleriaceae bacterium]|nr:hypothetical protein [Kofleriaceae bacterium]